MPALPILNTRSRHARSVRTINTGLSSPSLLTVQSCPLSDLILGSKTLPKNSKYGLVKIAISTWSLWIFYKNQMIFFSSLIINIALIFIDLLNLTQWLILNVTIIMHNVHSSPLSFFLSFYYPHINKLRNWFLLSLSPLLSCYLD